MKEFIGALMDEGYSPQEVRELVGPLAAEWDEENDLGSHVQADVDAPESVYDVDAQLDARQRAVRDVLTQARDDRQPPGPQVAVPSGVVNSLPQSTAAKAIRVDTEDTYRAFRQSGRDDLPEDTVEALSQLSQEELMGDFERGYASQWMLGTAEHQHRHRKHHRSRVGDIMTMEPASQTSLFSDPNLNPQQSCVVCGVTGSGAVCGNCEDRMPALLGLFERGYASQLIGLFERGSAASIHDDNPSATIEGMYRLPRHDGYDSGKSPLRVGDDGFFRLNHHEREYGDGLSALIGDVMALSVPSTVYAEEIPFGEKDFHSGKKILPHVAAWRQGAHIYGSIRVTGWDGKPRVLTTATPYAKEVGIVVGYSQSAAVPPTHTLAILDPLARKLGASRLFPRLAAAAPAVLRVSADKAAPIVLTAMPEGVDVDNSWV